MSLEDLGSIVKIFATRQKFKFLNSEQESITNVGVIRFVRRFVCNRDKIKTYIHVNERPPSTFYEVYALIRTRVPIYCTSDLGRSTASHGSTRKSVTS